jgi:hypothetical protein
MSDIYMLFMKNEPSILLLVIMNKKILGGRRGRWTALNVHENKVIWGQDFLPWIVWLLVNGVETDSGDYRGMSVRTRVWIEFLYPIHVYRR